MLRVRVKVVVDELFRDAIVEALDGHGSAHLISWIAIAD